MRCCDTASELCKSLCVQKIWCSSTSFISLLTRTIRAPTISNLLLRENTAPGTILYSFCAFLASLLIALFLFCQHVSVKLTEDAVTLTKIRSKLAEISIELLQEGNKLGKAVDLKTSTRNSKASWLPHFDEDFRCTVLHYNSRPPAWTLEYTSSLGGSSRRSIM